MVNSTSGTSRPINHLQVITWCVTYGLVAIATVTGNALTIAVLLLKKTSRKFGGHFLVNVAFADLMVGALALPMYIYIVYAFNYTPLNRSLPILQKVYTAVDVFTGLASILTLASIAVDRLYAVMFPLDYRSTTNGTYHVVICLVWLISGTASISYILSGPGVLSLLPENTSTYYLTIVSILSFFVICAAYFSIWMRIHLYNNRNKEFSAALKKEKRLATVLFIVTVVFVLTWSPFHIMNILLNFSKSVLPRIPLDFLFFVKLLHYINSLANPAIYSVKIPGFKIAMRQMLCKNWVPETRV